jgi:hypothetical protein
VFRQPRSAEALAWGTATISTGRTWQEFRRRISTAIRPTATDTPIHSRLHRVAYDPTKPAVGHHVSLAARNAADNVARTIRSQNAMGPIAIYIIGYTGNGGTDAGLLGA